MYELNLPLYTVMRPSLATIHDLLNYYEIMLNIVIAR